MAQINDGECDSVKTQLTTYLEQLQVDLNNVKTSIDDFNNISEGLMAGADFDKVKGHMYQYWELLDSIKNPMETLESNQSTANTNMETYVDERSSYVYVSDFSYVNNEDQLSYVNEKIEHYKKEIERYQNAIANFTYCSGCYNETVCTNNCAQTLASLKDSLECAKKLKEKYEKSRDYILRLDPEDSSAYNTFNEAVEALKTNIDSQNEAIIEMTIKSSVTSSVTSGNLSLDSAKSAALGGIGSTSNNYSSGSDSGNYNAEANADSGSVQSAVNTPASTSNTSSDSNSNIGDFALSTAAAIFGGPIASLWANAKYWF